MAELGSGSGSGYPASLDTDTSQESTSTVARANVPNDLAAAIIAIETELGTDPAGTLTNVKTFLQTGHATNGTHNFTDFTSANHGHISGATGGTLQYMPIRDQSRGLIVKTTGNDALDVDADELIAHDANGVPKKLSSVNLTLTMTNQWTSNSSVIDGRGIGITDANSTWYYIWVVNGTTGTGVVATTESGLAGALADVGTGYNTYGALVGCVRNDGSANFVTLYQRGNKVRCASGNITVSATTATSTDISAYVPANAKVVRFTSVGAGTGRLYIHPITFTVAVGNTYYEDLQQATDMRTGDCVIETAQTIFVARSTNNFTVYFHGWEY